jgi:hypothetical protein
MTNVYDIYLGFRSTNITKEYIKRRIKILEQIHKTATRGNSIEGPYLDLLYYIFDAKVSLLVFDFVEGKNG